MSTPASPQPIPPLLTVDPSYLSDSLSEASVRSAPYQKRSRTVDNVCTWVLFDGTLCSRHFIDPEVFYDHLTEDHVGRKTTGNLCLFCRIHGCSQPNAFSKRDHITSHLRSHVNNASHACEDCSKSFKWPHDLKKHHLKTGHGPQRDRTPSDTTSLKSRKSSVSRRRSVRSSRSTASQSQPTAINLQVPSGSMTTIPDLQNITSPPVADETYSLFRSMSYRSVHSGSSATSLAEDGSQWSESVLDDTDSLLTAESPGPYPPGVEYNPVDMVILSRYLEEISLPNEPASPIPISPQTSTDFGYLDDLLSPTENDAFHSSFDEFDFPLPPVLVKEHVEYTFLPLSERIADTSTNQIPFDGLNDLIDNEMTIRAGQPVSTEQLYDPVTSAGNFPLDLEQVFAHVLDNEHTIRPTISREGYPVHCDHSFVSPNPEIHRALAMVMDSQSTVRVPVMAKPRSISHGTFAEESNGHSWVNAQADEQLVNEMANHGYYMGGAG